MRAFEALKTYSKQLPTIYMSSIAEAFVQYIRYLANYFELDFKKELSRISENVSSDRIRYILKRIEETEELQTEQKFEANERQREIFYTILSDLKPYFNLTDARSLVEIGSIPEAPSNFTFELNSNGLRFGIEGEVDSDDFNEISYTVI